MKLDAIFAVRSFLSFSLFSDHLKFFFQVCLAVTNNSLQSNYSLGQCPHSPIDLNIFNFSKQLKSYFCLNSILKTCIDFLGPFYSTMYTSLLLKVLYSVNIYTNFTITVD